MSTLRTESSYIEGFRDGLLDAEPEITEMQVWQSRYPVRRVESDPRESAINRARLDYLNGKIEIEVFEECLEIALKAEVV